LWRPAGRGTHATVKVADRIAAILSGLMSEIVANRRLAVRADCSDADADV
jgi:5-carboxymethyl-2-hydroxymuconate isomerase